VLLFYGTCLIEGFYLVFRGPLFTGEVPFFKDQSKILYGRFGNIFLGGIGLKKSLND